MPKFTVKEIQDWEISTDLGNPSAKTYVPCRPGGGPFIWRLKAAWGVLTGKYDALDWGPGQRGEKEPLGFKAPECPEGRGDLWGVPHQPRR